MLAAIHVSLYASKSHYTLRPNDPEAVYVAPDKGDMTEKLQAAINKVKDTYNFGIVYIAEGTYTISRTLYVPAAVRLIGYGKRRPVIVLTKRARGFDHPDLSDKGKARYMIWFTSNTVHPGETPQDATAGTFYSAITNIDLRIATGNPHAVCLRTHYAQHCFIQHVDMYVDDGKAGIFDVGNEMQDVNIYGGEYGIYTTKTSPSWQMTILDSHITSQRKACILSEEGGLTLVGTTLARAPIGIEVMKYRSDKLFLEDCIFDNIAQTAIIESNEDYSPNQLSLRHVYCRKTPIIVRFCRSGKEVKGLRGLYCINELTHGFHQSDLASPSIMSTKADLTPVQVIPFLTSGVPALPAMDTWVNIVELGAVGDDHTDNTKVFREAIARYEVIYVPQGWYKVSEPLRLNPDTKLIGMNPISTQIKINDNCPAFSGSGSPVGLLETPAGGDNIISGIALYCGAWNNRAAGIKWQSGGSSYLNDIKFLGFHGTMPKQSRETLVANRPQSVSRGITANYGLEPGWDTQGPSLWIANSGGGTFKDIWSANTYASTGLLITDTDTPSRMYEVSVEHHVRNEVSMRNVSQWKFYSLQLEEEVREGRDVQQIDLIDCSYIMFANLYLFRVIWVSTPLPYAIRTWQCRDMEFYNLHNFTQMRYTTTYPLLDVNTGYRVLPWEFTRLTITGHEPKADTRYEGIERLGAGFEYAEGLCHDDQGHVYFCEERLSRIYTFDSRSGLLRLLSTLPFKPLALGCDAHGHVLVSYLYRPQPGMDETVAELPDRIGTTFSWWGNSGFVPKILSFDPSRPEQTISNVSSLNTDEAPHADRYLYATHRWRDLHDFDTVCTYRPSYVFVSADGSTVIPQQYDLVRTSSLSEAIPGRPFYCIDEYNHRVVAYDVATDGRLSRPREVYHRGENGLAVDDLGNIYVAEGDIFVFSPLTGTERRIACPERPLSLTICDGYLYFTSAAALYRMRLL